MAFAFVDTSALLKLYVREVGTRWMLSVVRPAGMCVSELIIAELGAALARRGREGSLAVGQRTDAWRRFEEDLNSFMVAPVNGATMRGAAGIATRSPVAVRALDAIQLQGALDVMDVLQAQGLPAPFFVSADRRLLLAAQHLGFQTDDPEQHP